MREGGSSGERKRPRSALGRLNEAPALAVVAAYTLLAAIVFPVFPHFVSPNELTRWGLAAALVEEHSVEVSRPAAILGPRFEDLAEREGRLYSNKAPGIALISLPGYLLARPFAGPPSGESLRLVLTAMRWFGATLPLLLLALLFVRLARSAGIDGDRTAVVVWVLLFATPLFAYGLLLFSHAFVGAALFAGWALLYAERRLPFVAGLLLGFAVASEYPAAIPTAIAVVALAIGRRWRDLGLTIAGGVPLALLLVAYHHVAFGSAVPYLYERLPEYRAVARSGFFGLQLPSPVIAMRLLFDPGRGLLTYSPVLISGVVALAAAKKRLSAPAFRTLVAMPLSLFLVYSCYPNWHGGWGVGPRYIVAILPFVVFPMLYRAGSALESVLAGWSALTVGLTSLVFPFVPNDFVFPWSTLAMPLLADGLIAPNALHPIGRALAVAVPLAIAFGAAMVLRRRIVLAIAGAAAAFALGAFASQLASPRLLELQRAYIADVYFSQQGTLERAAPVPPGLVRRRELERRLPPPEWPF